MEPLVIAVAGLIAIAVCAQLGPRIGVASPLILLALGALIGFLPFVDPIALDPALVLEAILPPLLFGAAASMPVMDFRRDLAVVAGLAIGLVVVTTLLLGLVVHALIPTIALPWAIALGAVLSPTDAVAVSIARNQGVSYRVVTVLEGEGLFNDATALVLLGAGVSAALQVDAEALAPTMLALDFVVALLVAIAIGFVVGELGVRARARITEPAADTVLSFAMPFLASIPAEHLGGSGLVAAVVAGLVVSHRRIALIPAQNRRFAQQNWATLEFVLEGAVFLTMGLQAYGIVTTVNGGDYGLGRAALVALVAGALTLVARALFVAPFLAFLASKSRRQKVRLERFDEAMAFHEERIAHACDAADELMAERNLSKEQWDAAIARRRQRVEKGRRRAARKGRDVDYFLREPLRAREGSVLVWAGMRGAVTLAAAQTLPLSAPARSFLLLIALLVAAGSLSIQGLTLPVLIRAAKPQMAVDSHDEEERERLLLLLRSTLKETALARAITEAHPAPALGRTSSPIDLRASVRKGIVVEGEDGPRREPLFGEERARELAIEAIHAQRAALIEARDDRVFSSAALERALERIDYEEIMLSTKH